LINLVAVHQARLVLGWVNVRSSSRVRIIWYLVIHQVKSAEV